MTRLNRAHVDWHSPLRLLTMLSGAFGLFFACADLAASNCRLIPTTLEADRSLTGNSDANGVLEPGETVDIEPFWSKRVTCDSREIFHCRPPTPPEFSCFLTPTETGTASSTSTDYVLLDAAARYPSLKGCSPDCYSLLLPAPTRRPARHWDVGFTEVLSGIVAAGANRKVHVGESFTDVPRTDPFYKPIETLFHNGVTTGCAPQGYCPSRAVTRSDAATLLSRALARGANIPSSGSVNGHPYDCSAGGASLFDDVAPTDFFCRHAHALAAQNIMKACRPNAFCPTETISRVVMAVHVARAMVGGNDDDIPWSGCDPLSATPYSFFTDVPASNDFCKFVNFLSSRGVVNGCGPHQFCPAGLVTRDQMAKLLVRALDLQLNGP